MENEPLSIEMMVEYVEARRDLNLIGVATELEALAAMIRNALPEIIFLDLIIPPGNSGDFHYGMLPAESVVIVVSAVPLSDYKEGGLLNNPYELNKPVSLGQFNECVDAAIHRLLQR